MMKNLILVVMGLIMMVGCNEKKAVDMLSGEWTVVSIEEGDVPASAGAFLGFDTVEKVVYGSTGCNQLTGAMPVDVNGSDLLFGALGCTRRMCADMSVEDAMLPALGKVVDFKIEGDALSLLDAEGNTVIALQKRQKAQ